MKTRMVEERIGEYLGPIDWSHPMIAELESTAWGKTTVAWLRKLEATPDAFLATTDGGSPKFGYRPVLLVGMYDGWPYWAPTPSFCLSGMFGGEWHSASCLTDILDKTPSEKTPPTHDGPTRP